MRKIAEGPFLIATFHGAVKSDDIHIFGSQPLHNSNPASQLIDTIVRLPSFDPSSLLPCSAMTTHNEHGHPITPLDHSAWVTIMTALMMTYMVLFHLARLMIRFTINGPFGIDDHIVSAGAVSILHPFPPAVVLFRF